MRVCRIRIARRDVLDTPPAVYEDTQKTKALDEYLGARTDGSRLAS